MMIMMMITVALIWFWIGTPNRQTLRVVSDTFCWPSTKLIWTMSLSSEGTDGCLWIGKKLFFFSSSFFFLLLQKPSGSGYKKQTIQKKNKGYF